MKNFRGDAIKVDGISAIIKWRLTNSADKIEAT